MGWSAGVGNNEAGQDMAWGVVDWRRIIEWMGREVELDWR